MNFFLFKGSCKPVCQRSSLLRKSFLPFFPPSQGHTRRTAGLGPALSVLDLGQNGQHVYQSPAQPRTRENDAANNIITALVHISLIWQKPSLSSVSHMVHCPSIKGRGSTNGRILNAFFCMSSQNKLVLVGLYKRQHKVIFFETTTLAHNPKYVKSVMSQLY